MFGTFIANLRQLLRVYPVPAQAMHLEFLTAAFSSAKHPIMALAGSIPASAGRPPQPLLEWFVDWKIVQNDVAYALAQAIEFDKLPSKISSQMEAYNASGQPYGYTHASFQAPYGKHPAEAAAGLKDMLQLADQMHVPVVTYNMLGFFWPFCENLLRWTNLPTESLIMADLYDPCVLVKAAMLNVMPAVDEQWHDFALRLSTMRCGQKHNLLTAAQTCGIQLHSESLQAVRARALPYNVRLCQLLLDRWRDL